MLTELKVVLVGERVGDAVRLGDNLKDLLGHLVHGVLNTGALILGEELERNVAGRLPRLVKLGDRSLDSLDVGEGRPLPTSFDIGGENTVPGLGQGGVLIPVEAVEGGASALQHAQPSNAAVKRDAILAAHSSLDVPRLIAVLEEAVRVRLAIDRHPHPAVGDDLDVGDVDVGVLFNEVRAEDGGVELWRGDRVLLGNKVDGVLDGVCGDDDAVVGLCIGLVDVALEEAADGHLDDGLDAGRSVAMDLVDADVVLAIAGC